MYRASSARPAFLRGLLAVLRRSRVPIFSSISILSIWGFSLNLSFLAYLAYAEYPPFRTFLRRNHQNENFSFLRFLAPFGAVLGRFAHFRQFQITSYQSVLYLKNCLLSTPLQRLPGQKRVACNLL